MVSFLQCFPPDNFTSWPSSHDFVVLQPDAHDNDDDEKEKEDDDRRCLLDTCLSPGLVPRTSQSARLLLSSVDMALENAAETLGSDVGGSTSHGSQSGLLHVTSRWRRHLPTWEWS